MSAETASSTTAEPAPREVTMTLEEALAYGVKHHQAGHLDEAETVYDAVLKRQPERAEVLNWLGILKRQRGDLAAAAALMRRVVELKPDADGVWLRDSGRYAHDGAHVRSVSAAAGLRVEPPVATVLREESEAPARGWLVVARRAD